MGKKTGILTFHRGFSYGAVLQAYALQNFLSEIGIENEIIDYRCKYMEDHYQKIFRKNSGNKIKGFIWNMLMADDIIKSRKTYPVFVENFLKKSCSYDSQTIEKTKHIYRKIIVGSDQVWSPDCVGFDPVYFLNFAFSEQKFSYAASIAANEIPKKLEEKYKARLSDFQSFSLREKSGKDLVESLTGKSAQVHTDPTFLLGQEQWDKLAGNQREKEPYIFLFTVLKPRNLIEYARKLSEKTGYKILYLNNQSPKKIRGIEYLDPVMPDRFVELIKNAEYVCTNSFHGTAFSMIYEKKFVAETKTAKGDNIRSRELMKNTGLSDRILDDMTVDIDVETDWKIVRNYIEKERELSRKYLLSI